MCVKKQRGRIRDSCCTQARTFHDERELGSTPHSATEREMENIFSLTLLAFLLQTCHKYTATPIINERLWLTVSHAESARRAGWNVRLERLNERTTSGDFILNAKN